MIQDIAPHKYYVDYHPSTPNDTDLVSSTVITQFCAILKIRRSAILRLQKLHLFPGNPGKSKISVPYRRNQLL